MAKHFSERRQELCAWLDANGINPHDVPNDADITVEPGPADTRVIHYESYVRNEHGRITLNERGDSAAIEKRSVLMLVAPPTWWQPFEKPTREQLLATLERVRNIPRLPHHSQQTGDLGRAYTRGWESVISALDKALDGESAPMAGAEYEEIKARWQARYGKPGTVNHEPTEGR